MKADYINPFIEAAFYVLKEILADEGIKRGALELRTNPYVSRGVATLVGLNGQLRGHVIYDMSKKTPIRIAGVMNGEEFAGLDNIVRSTISELANMITGNAATKLVDAGYVCNITPPTFLVGDPAEIYAYKEINHLLVPFTTSCGMLNVSVALAPNV